MNKVARAPFHDTKFFNRVCKEKPAEGSPNQDWATLFNSWMEGWDEAEADYTNHDKQGGSISSEK